MVISGFILGLIICSFSLLQVLICIFFGIPITIKLTREGVLVRPNPIVKRYFLSIFILLTIFVTMTTLFYLYSPEFIFNGYVVGVVITLILAIGKFGKNQNNIDDFIETNSRYFNKNRQDI